MPQRLAWALGVVLWTAAPAFAQVTATINGTVTAQGLPAGSQGPAGPAGPQGPPGSGGGGSANLQAARGEFNITDFGAKCDGATDDTNAIKAAIDAAQPKGTIVLPAGSCKFTSTLNFGDDSGQMNTTGLSMRGAGEDATRLIWMGSTSAPALTFTKNKYAALNDLTLANGVARGTTTGVLMTGYGTGGTEDLQEFWHRVQITGFSIGLQLGGGVPGQAASDNSFYDLALTSNNYGIWTADLNTLNDNFYNLECGQNTIACIAMNEGNMSVHGGSSNGDGVDFLLAGDQFAIDGSFRAELSPGSAFIKVPGAINSLSVRACMTAQDTGPTTYAVFIETAKFVDLEGNLFSNRITIDNYVAGGTLVVKNNDVNGDVKAPVFFNPANAPQLSDAVSLFVDFEGNNNNGGVPNTINRYPDFVGGAAADQGTGYPHPYLLTFRPTPGPDVYVIDPGECGGTICTAKFSINPIGPHASCVAAFKAASLMADCMIATLPVHMKILSIVAENTNLNASAFGCSASCTGTKTMSAGTSLGGTQLFAAGRNVAVQGQFGLVDADLGSGLNRAGAVQGGFIPSWSATTPLLVRFTSGTGPWGNGLTTFLSSGSIMFYLTTEALP